jgi:hypothetical protein
MMYFSSSESIHLLRQFVKAHGGQAIRATLVASSWSLRNQNTFRESQDI